MNAQPRLLGGRYQVGELLGYGGMAEVHRGRDLRLGRDVAIKLLRTDLARDQTFQMRFRREAQNAAALNHPAIVAVYDTGEERAPTGEALPYIVMEFVNGHTLKEVLAAEGRLQPRRALEIVADVCAALEFSHRHGIIHRDIKPGNVMLTQTGQVKVMDFGIARALASGATTMTQTSAVIGTAQYLSPEQARGEAVDARSDVYAAGCVLFELLCGHPPFVGDSPVSVAYQHVREDPRAPSDVNRDVNPDIDAIVLKALAKNPLNRYQSAAEMRADLLRAATGRPVSATPVLRQEEMTAVVAPQPMPGPGGRRPAAGVGDPRRRRNSGLVIAALAALGVFAAIAVVAGLLLLNNDEEKPRVAMPRLIELPIEEAEAKLTAAQFAAPTIETVKRDGCTLDEVLAQTPAPDEQVVPSETTVALTTCGGEDLVQIPDLQGFTEQAAGDELRKRNLVPKFTQVNSDQAIGTVVRVREVGKQVKKGTEVVVEISRGNMRTVPDVVGKSQEDAQRELANAGFRVSVVPGDEVDPEDAGEVVAQSPRDGQQRAGTTITITVTVPREDDPGAEPSSPPPSSPTP